MADVSPQELGRRLVREMRLVHYDELASDDSATDRLRWGADFEDDETVWGAVLGAIEEAQSERERFGLGDGFIAESVLVRPVLEKRFETLFPTNEAALALAAVMAQPSWNWDGPDSIAYWQARLATPESPS